MIYVLGTGRSGTSTVARIIHQSGLACMGHDFAGENGFNPLGYWEDRHVRHELLTQFISGNPIQFEANVKKYHRLKGCEKPLGFKHPLLCNVPREHWIKVEPEAVYWCQRPKAETLDSMNRFRTFNRGRPDPNAAIRLYEGRMRKLEIALDGLPFVKVIDFSEQRSDEWVRSQL